jgi:uncharacterized protein YcfJ
VSLGACISTVRFLLIVDTHWFYDRLDRTLLAAKICRHTVVTNRRPVRDEDAVAGRESGVLAQRWHDSVKRI